MTEDTDKGRLSDPLSLNLYTYCHNEPIMYVDPDGHREIKGTTVDERKKETVTKKVEKIIKEAVKAFEIKLNQVDKVVNALRTTTKAVEKGTEVINKAYYRDEVTSKSFDLNVKVGTLKHYSEAVTSTYDAVRNPKETIKGIADLASTFGSPARDEKQMMRQAQVGASIGLKLTNEVNDFKKADANTKIMKATGYTLTTAEIAVPILAERTAAAKAASGSKVVNSLDDVDLLRYKGTGNASDLTKAPIEMDLQLLTSERTGYTSGSKVSDLLRPDKFTKKTTQLTEWRRSIDPSDIKYERELFLGENAVKVDAGKWRSLDGTRQFRVKPQDYLGQHPIGKPAVPDTPHVHFEFLQPSANGAKFEVIKNVHVPIR